MSSAPSSDDDLRERLRNRIGSKSDPDENSDPTEGEAMDGDDEEDDDDEDMEMDADMVDEEAVEEAAQMIADAMGDDVGPGQVVELLDPLMGEEDTRDAETELAGEEGDAEDTESEAGLSESDVADMVDERLDEKLGDFEATVDEKLSGVVDELADETRDVLQKAEVGDTPTPTATGGASDSPALFSDERAEGDD